MKVTEKRRPSYDLEAVKRVFSTLQGLSITTTALTAASELGFLPLDIVATMQAIERRHVVKSITTYSDHRVWQDVYHVPSEAGLLYVKVPADRVTEYRLVSFKEKDDG